MKARMSIMKKAVLLWGLMSVACLRADVLYWFIDQEDGASDSIKFAYASMVRSDGAFYLTPDDADAVLANDTQYDLHDNYRPNGVGMLIGNDSEYSGWSFYIELYDSGWNVVGKSIKQYSFKDAEVKSAISHGATEPWTPLTVTGFVPEPTSGLLMLMGMALLTLRRKDVERSAGRVGPTDVET